MKQAIEINLEYGMSTADDAIKRYGKNQCLVIIHGYGSSGKGGVIRQKARQWLNAQVRNGKIKRCVNGEDFGIFSNDTREMYSKYSGLEQYKDRGNHGITIIET
jgi:hypothetical protein